MRESHTIRTRSIAASQVLRSDPPGSERRTLHGCAGTRRNDARRPPARIAATSGKVGFRGALANLTGRSHARKQVCPLRLELFWGEDALVAKLSELLNLLNRVKRRDFGR